MVLPTAIHGETASPTAQNHDHLSERQAFDATKAGVKGLVDEGTTTVPQIFIHPPHNLEHITTNHYNGFNVPVIDLDGVNNFNKHKEIVKDVLNASQIWGFFQLVNHGIPLITLEAALDGVRNFHNQDVEMKKVYYTRDFTRKMLYNSNFDLYTAPAACWRDSFNYIAAPNPPPLEELPIACQDILVEYSKRVMELGIVLLKLLSEALELDPNHPIDMDCAQTLALFGHYYPACLEPECTLGTMKHSDYGFLTILLQDRLGGLQVLHQSHWVDIGPLPGALVVNIGDLLQLISNDKFRSVEHRVLASRVGPRVSLPAFFGRDTCGVNLRVYGPINELVTEENPPKYHATTLKEYTTYFRNKGCDGISALQSFKV